MDSGLGITGKIAIDRFGNMAWSSYLEALNFVPNEMDSLRFY